MDIVERLREYEHPDEVIVCRMKEAADEIERLNRLVDSMRAELADAKSHVSKLQEVWEDTRNQRDALKNEFEQFKKDGGNAIIWNKRRCEEMEAERDAMRSAIEQMRVAALINDWDTFNLIIENSRTK